MKRAFNREIARSIMQSAGRFAAIAIISLLGAGVYAGLRMAAPDMRLAGDEFFDGCGLYDIGLVSTLGFDDDSLEALRAIEGVGAVMPARCGDAMALSGESSWAAHIESIPLNAARASDVSDGVHARTDDPAYLNRPLLVAGSWPSNDRECVVGVDGADELGIAIGQTISLEEKTSSDGDDEDEPLFDKTELAVSGFVNSPAFCASSMLGTTALGSGRIELYLYVPSGTFNQDLPYTMAYLSVPSASDRLWDTPAYDQEIQAVKERVRDAAFDIGEARWQAVVDEAQTELDDTRDEYRTKRLDAEDELSDAKAELDDARAELADAKTQLDDARAELERGHGDLRAAYEKLRDSQKTLESSHKKLAATKDKLDSACSQLEKTYALVEQMRTGIEAGLITDEKSLAQYSYLLAEYEKGLVKYNAGLASYAAGVEQYDAGVKRYREGKAAYERGVAKYRSGAAEYAEGVAEYNDGTVEYDDGRLDYIEGIDEANDKFAEAEEKIADAQRKIDDIEHPEIYVIDRSKNAGAASLSSDAEGISQIALFIPLMFFLVAALVSLTSMTRMVEEERLAIGTHKALGYGKARIMSKYLVYGMLASGLGSAVGTVALGKLLPYFILVSYGISYAVPLYPTPIDVALAARAIGLSVGITCLATIWAATQTLRESPAALMLPRVPKAGKRIVLERITPLWSRLSFSHKVTARNLLRYKRRFFMAVIGVAGCTALLMVGFGLRDAIGGIVSNQYETLVGYDAAVRSDDDMAEDARIRRNDLLAHGDVSDSLHVADFNLIAQGSRDELRIEVVVPSEPKRLQEFVTLRNRVSGQTITPEGNLIVLTEKAADVLGVTIGDSVVLFDENDVGDKTGAGRSFYVGGIAENYLGHYAYLLPSGYEAAFEAKPDYNLALVKLSDTADREAFSKRLLKCDGVSTVSFVADEITIYENMLDVMNKLIYVIMLLSAALAFVVLYNLTNINITERVREIATLKVLGFTRGETSAYIFREVLVMTLIGAMSGCVLGVPLTFYIAKAAETANMMFGRTIEPASFALSFALTMVFAAIVTFAMRGKLAKVDMVESLKSNE